MLAFVQSYTDMGYISILLFVFIGTILTMVVQASAATMAITLIMCANGWISFELGAALVLGENIGTTITANLAALTGNTQARRGCIGSSGIQCLRCDLGTLSLYTVHEWCIVVCGKRDGNERSCCSRFI